MVVPNCCNTPAWCHNAGGPKSRDTGTARLWSQKSWWCGCLRPPIIVTVNSLLLGEWLHDFHSKDGYEWHHFLGWTFVNVKCWWVNYFIFLVSLWLHSPDSGWPPMVPDPGRSERRRSGHRPLSLPSSVAVLPSSLLAKPPKSKRSHRKPARTQCGLSVRRTRLCTAAYWQSHYHFGWAQDSSPRIQKHEERLKRRKNILELSHLIENFICNCFIACHCSDSSGTGLITSENTTIDCC